MNAIPSLRRVSVRSLLGAAGGIVLGAVLLLAAAAKVLDPMALAEQIRAEGVGGPTALSSALALVVLALEAGLGLALVAGLRTKRVLIAATMLVALFVFLTGRAYWRDARGLASVDASCGCFGNLVERTPAEAFWQDLLLLVPSLGLAWWGRRWRDPASEPGFWRRGLWRTTAAWTAAAAAAVIGFVAPRLPVDDLATRLKPGTDVALLCSGREPARVCLTGVVPELEAGTESWVILADVRSPEFAALVPDLNGFARRPGALPLVVITSAPSDEVRAFFWRSGPAFPIREAPLPLLRPLYRALPRSFRVAGGQVVETAAGIAPVLLPPTGPTRAS